MTNISSAEEAAISAVFAYGTLKLGQCRESCWPLQPEGIVAGTVRGTLWDIGPYPGLTVGDDLVRGEIWVFAKGDMPRTLQALDLVEGFSGKSNDWFVRKPVVATAATGQQLLAWVYFYGRTLLATARQALPAEDGTVSWP